MTTRPGVDLVLPNLGEYNLRNPALRLGAAAERVFAALGVQIGDQSVFWTARPRVLVLSAGVDTAWFEDVHEVMGWAAPPIVSPESRSGRLLKDLLRDGSALAALRDALAGRPRVRLVTWGATPELYVLAGVLRGWGHEVELDCTPEDDYWASLYLDSKVSCQDLANRLGSFTVPPGVTASNELELRGALEAVLGRHQRAIVKSHYGVGGDGIAVVRAEGRGLSSFWHTVHRDPFLREYPLVVQQFVEHAPEAACPAVDMLITDDGVRRIVLSAMAVVGHRLRGVCVGRTSVPAEVGEQISRIGAEVGGAAHELGFRGWFCIDYLRGVDGRLHVTEFNARRSGAAHAIELLDHWGAAGELVAYSADRLELTPRPGLSYAEHLRPVFRRLWSEGVRVVPMSVRGLANTRPSVGVVAVAATAAEAELVVTTLPALVDDHFTGTRAAHA